MELRRACAACSSPLLPSGVGPHTVPSCLAGGVGVGQTTERCEGLGKPSAVAVVYSQSGTWAGRNPVLLHACRIRLHCRRPDLRQLLGSEGRDQELGCFPGSRRASPQRRRCLLPGNSDLWEMRLPEEDAL